MKELGKFTNKGIVTFCTKISKGNKDPNREGLSRGDYNGYLSKDARKKIQQILSMWLNGIAGIKYEVQTKLKSKKANELLELYGIELSTAQKQRLKKAQSLVTNFVPIFVTLTLSSEQMHEDNFIKRNMLQYFITKVQRLHNVTFYYWFAEKQKNGNIHFHLILDRYIDWRDIRTIWNNIQDAHRYIEPYSAKMREKYKNGFVASDVEIQNFGLEKCKSRYDIGKKESWKNPNSTDVKSILTNDEITAYITKYVTKINITTDENGRKVEKINIVDGRLWGMSDELRKIGYYSTENVEILQEIDEFYKLNDSLFSIEETHFKFYAYNNFDFVKKINEEIYNEIIFYAKWTVNEKYLSKNVDVYECIIRDIVNNLNKSEKDGK